MPLSAMVCHMTDTLNGRAAANIRAELARRELTQVELASRLGLSESALSRRLKKLTLWDLDNIALVLQVEPSKLLND